MSNETYTKQLLQMTERIHHFLEMAHKQETFSQSIKFSLFKNFTAYTK